jgi:hypothetical protein
MTIKDARVILQSPAEHDRRLVALAELRLSGPIPLPVNDPPPAPEPEPDKQRRLF